METLFIYLIKSSGLIVMFYLAYYFLLRKETFFNSNRWFLLAGLITSVLLPLVVFTKTVWVDPNPNTFDWSKIPMTTTTVENEAFEINWYLVFAVVYSIGILSFLMKFAFDFQSLSKVLNGKTIKQQADFKFIDVTENISPFSYFNYIVYNSSLYSGTELENILEHEKVHSSQNHTVDVLISRLFCIVFWFNPLVWLYKKAIVQNLEFIADSEASKNIADKKAYQLTLLKITTHENCVAITNHFYQSLIKKRIVMLNKNQSNKRNSWKYALVLPALGAFVFLFQVEVVAQEKESVQTEIKLEKNDKTNLIITKNTTDEEVNGLKVKGVSSLDGTKPLIVVNGKTKDPNFNSNDIPKDQIKKIEVLKGKIAEDKYGEKGKNGVIEIETKEVIVVGYGTKKEKGKNEIEPQQIIVEGYGTKKQINGGKLTGFSSLDGTKPLIVVDGKTKDPNFNIEDIPKEQIEKINVFKGKLAEDKYGDKGKNGVVEITTKGKNGKNEIEPQQIIVEGYGTKKQINGGKLTGFSSLDGTKPLIVVDGKTKDSNFNIEDIPKEQIKKINVFKGKLAEDKYGEKGKNGVIEIETK